MLQYVFEQFPSWYIFHHHKNIRGGADHLIPAHHKLNPVRPTCHITHTAHIHCTAALFTSVNWVWGGNNFVCHHRRKLAQTGPDIKFLLSWMSTLNFILLSKLAWPLAQQLNEKSLILMTHYYCWENWEAELPRYGAIIFVGRMLTLVPMVWIKSLLWSVGVHCNL